jgi:AcrR family transcriptional regulator
MSRPRGRRPGDPEVTRRTILTAARATFAEAGYEQATIRAIAAAAGVDPALIHHHFGTKEELFVAAHEFPISPARLVEALRSDDAESLGKRVTRLYLQAEFTERLESLIRAAMSNERARTMLREFVERGVLDTLEGRLDVPDARLRLGLAASHLVGVFLARRVVGIDAIRDADLDVLVGAVGTTIDRYLEGIPTESAP